MVAAESGQRKPVKQLAVFLVASDNLSVEQMASVLGTAADIALAKGAIREGAIARIPARQSTWEMREEALSAGEAVGQMLGRLRPLRSQVRELLDRGCVVKFSVVQYAGRGTDLSFALDGDDLRLLAEMKALIDVVHYSEH
ncbi:DUF4279 domain-containing protein [Micromonospora sp. NPDC048835]|uniref:DUF4279 domain-containing protein n=1 Tax=Micromonospora sp. NPDC048835 TaxID=3155147 RepID=UPI0033C9AB91